MSRFPKGNPDIVFMIAMNRLEAQRRQVDALDSKIGTLLGFGGVLIAIMAGFLALRDDPVTTIQFALLCVAGGTFIGIAITSLRAYHIKSWEIGPSLGEAWENAGIYGSKTMKWWAAESFIQCYENNRERVNRKIRAVKILFALLPVEVTALSLGLGLGLVAIN